MNAVGTDVLQKGKVMVAIMRPSVNQVSAPLKSNNTK